MTKKDKEYSIKEIKFPIRISSSKINVFNECILKYLFQSWSDIDIKQIIWPGNLLGQSCHRILEHAICEINAGTDRNNILRQTKGMFEDKFWELREEVKKDKRMEWRESRKYQEETYLRTGEKYAQALVKFILNFVPDEFFKLLSEQSMEKPWVNDSDILITGITDLIIRSSEQDFKIFDLKVTSKSSQYFFVNWEKNIQSIMYQYLTNQIFNELPKSFGFIVMDPEEKLLFYKEKKIKADAVNYSYIDNIIKQMKKIIFDVQENGFSKQYKCRDNNLCKWCEYKKECAKI